MNKNNAKIVCTIILLLLTHLSNAQLSPINFEAGGNGATWTWTTFENATNPPTTIVTNPNTMGNNTSANCIKMTTLIAGNPWAGFESLHGAGIGTFTLDSTNCIVKLMVLKNVISDVGVKFATAAGASTGEIKVANTQVGEWEELTFDFTSQIGNPVNTNIDQIIIFPDFTARTTNNDCFIDNITLGTSTSQNINVTFATQATDSLPVYIFGNWNNWNNFPGVPMVYNSSKARYEATLPFNGGSTIEYLFVNGTNTKEVLNPNWPCTNGNAQYTNRKVTLGNIDTTFCNIWATCNTCAPLGITNFNNKNIAIELSKNYLQILASSPAQFTHLEIFDIVGKRIFSTNKTISAHQKLDISLLDNTYYIVRFKEGNQVYQFKTIIN
jgi:hypothetical protein